MFIAFDNTYFNVNHIIYFKTYMIQSNERTGYWIEILTTYPDERRYYERFNENEKELFLLRKKQLEERLKIL